MSLQSDLREMMRDFGVSLVFQGYLGRGCVSVATEEDSLVGDQVVAGKTRAVTFPTSDLPGLKIGSNLSVGGVAFVVRALRLQDDGAVSKAYLGAS